MSYIMSSLVLACLTLSLLHPVWKCDSVCSEFAPQSCELRLQLCLQGPGCGLPSSSSLSLQPRLLWLWNCLAWVQTKPCRGPRENQAQQDNPSVSLALIPCCEPWQHLSTQTERIIFAFLTLYAGLLPADWLSVFRPRCAYTAHWQSLCGQARNYNK